MQNKIIPYRSDLREQSRHLRKNQTLAEKLLWNKIRRKALGVQFHRQVPMLDYIVDFYCHEIGLAIEIDGSSHDNMFLYDAKRQGRLEKEGVKFIRFSNDEISTDIQMVLYNLEIKIKELLNE